MSINNLNTYLNVRDAHLRVVSGNVYAQAMNIGGINVETAHGLQSVSNTGNATSLTLEFANVTTGFVTTANAQIGRDLVVTGNATVSKELTITSNAIVSSNLNVSDDLIVTNNILASNNLTVAGNINVTTVMSDSNVVAEYTGPHDRPLRKYPEVALTADAATASGYKGYKVTSSFDHTTYQDWNAFDGVTDATVGWHTGSAATNDIQYTGTDGEYNGTNATQLSSSSNTVNGEYLQVELPKAIKLKYYVLYPQGTSGVDQYNSPTRAVLYGSNDGSVWTEVHRYTDAIYDTDKRAGIGYTFHVNSNQSYNYFAIVPTHRDDTAGTPANTSGISIGELEFYGHEEGSGSLDTTLKTVYNVPATTGTQLEVYYDGQDYSDMPTVGSASVIDKAGGDQTGTPSSGASFDSTYKAFVFDGTTNGKIVGTHNLSGTSPVLTMSFWMKRTTVVGNYDYIATIGTSTTGQMIGLTTNPSNQFNFGNFGDGVITEEPILLNQWYHVTLVANGEAVFNSTNFKPYINGKEPRLSGHGGGTTTNLTGTQLTLGTNTNSAEAFNGSIANFRLYSKALNADQVKELYDYQKDYFLGSKSQVTLYKGHLGVGVTEPSGQLELAGDERIQEYPPGPMSDYDTNIPGHGVFKAYASNENTNVVWEAFDKSNNNGRHYQHSTSSGGGYSTSDGSYGGSVRLSSSSGTPLGVHVILKMPYQIYLKQFSIQPRNNAGYLSEQTPKDGQVWGSNDGNSWYHLYSYTGLTFTSGTDTVYFNVNHTDAYSYYALIVTKSGGGTNSFEGFSIGELRYFGTPGPTTLDKGSLSLTRSLDVPRVSRYDVDTETPRPEKLVVDFDTTVNSSPTDISGQGNHGTLVGATYSPADKAFSFDGGDYIQGSLTNSSSNFTNTVSLWFKMDDLQSTLGTPSTTGNRRTIFEFGDIGNRSGLNFGFVDIRDTYMTIYMGDTATLPSSAFAPQQNQWHHLVLMYSGSGTLRIFIDNTDYTSSLAGVVNGTLAIQVNADLLLGSEGRLNAAKFRGDISNFKIYSVALEPSEVQKLYRLGRTGRSMVISDTAVGIGKVPEAQLDVRGTARFADVMINGSAGNGVCSLSLTENPEASAGVRLKYDGVDNAL